jgi:hypothetical protein
MAERITDVATLRQDDSPHALMAMALESKADPAILSRLMDLQERWDATQARKAYVEAMSAFKRDVPSVLRKDAAVDFTTAKGRTHYKHASLGGIVNQVTVAMGKHGLSASWETKQAQGVVTVTCHVTHCQGHRESVTLSGPPDDSGNKNVIQQIGSSVTYLQRYTLLSALGLATADQDDADNRGPRKPVEMPTAKAPAAAPATDAGNTGAPPQDAPEGEHVTGTLETVTVKAGTGKGGKAWTRYGLTVAGQQYGTFDDKLGALAEELRNREVVLTWKAEGKYKTATDIALASGTPPPKDTDRPSAHTDGPQEKLPF